MRDPWSIKFWSHLIFFLNGMTSLMNEGIKEFLSSIWSLPFLDSSSYPNLEKHLPPPSLHLILKQRIQAKKWPKISFLTPEAPQFRIRKYVTCLSRFHGPTFFFLLLFYFICYLIFIVIFPLPFSPLIPLSHHNYHTVVHVPESFFLFAQSFHLFTSPRPLAVILLSIYGSVPIFLVSSICSLDSTYDWDHTVFVFLWLAYFT